MGEIGLGKGFRNVLGVRVNRNNFINVFIKYCFFVREVRLVGLFLFYS